MIEVGRPLQTVPFQPRVLDPAYAGASTDTSYPDLLALFDCTRDHRLAISLNIHQPGSTSPELL